MKKVLEYLYFDQLCPEHFLIDYTLETFFVLKHDVELSAVGVNLV